MSNLANQDRNREIYEEAYSYLLSFDDVDESLIDRHLDKWKSDDVDDMNQLYRGLLVSLQNRQGMPNSIGDLDKLEPLLYGFSPASVVENYDSWRDFFKTVDESDKITPPGRFQIENSQSHWVQYSKSVLSGAEFLTQFAEITEFSEFVSGFNETEYTRYSLPLLLDERIHGLGFALACDFLKENGYPQFVKPDVHLKDLFLGLGLSNRADDFEIFLDIIRFAESVDEVPYRVDKLFWLIGSGRFYLEEPELRINTDKQEFISQVRRTTL